MSDDSAVEVEISKIGNTLLDGIDVIQKSSAHPSHKVSHKNFKKYFDTNAYANPKFLP
jgi:hypothetical protein